MAGGSERRSGVGAIGVRVFQPSFWISHSGLVYGANPVQAHVNWFDAKVFPLNFKI